ncbi:MAG: FCD domain-containing protein [Betaproteobacteria bacterium]
MLREHSLTSLVQHEIERKIISGELGAGAKLNEAKIADELQVSCGLVREACRALGLSGLVRTEKNRGVFVREITLDEAYEIYEIRAALEGMIGRLAAKRIQPAQMQRLRELVKRMNATSRALDANAYFPLNIEFHEVLGQAAANGALLRNYRRIVNELNLYRRELTARSAQSIPAAARDHEDIVNAIAQGDAALAERLLIEHVLNSRDRLHRLLEDGPAVPAGAARPAPRKAAT